MISVLAKLYKNIILILFVFTLVVGNILIGSTFPDCESELIRNLAIGEASQPIPTIVEEVQLELCKSAKRLSLFYLVIFNISVLLTYGAIATIIDVNDNLKKLVNKE